MPRPPQMWVEGFAARLHAGPIQEYETPIQVWQTWRLDQVRKVLTQELHHLVVNTYLINLLVPV
jgi:hypothetical protein